MRNGYAISEILKISLIINELLDKIQIKNRYYIVTKFFLIMFFFLLNLS